MPSVVILTHTQVHGGLVLSTGGISTGFVVSQEGHIMTCAHCAGKERQFIDKRGIHRNIFLESETYVKFLDRDISPVRAELVVAVPEFDLAILKIPGLPEGVMANTVVSFSETAPEIGDSVFVTGHPSLEYATRCGIISSPACFPHHFSFSARVFEDLFKRTVNGLHLIEIDINCRPGFSGAPVFSPTGEVVGMVLATLANTTLALPSLFCQAVVNYALHNPSIGGAKIMGGARFIPEDLKVESHLVARLSVKKD
ncbi:hypothetical protein Vadar_027763 [Vaccinium darrowii]|uniref:Uncharacterized protein n=1 Tax=Vaccinium darrowii TaxID=229202 RepID=A0ACB7XKT5_9ERIC|nr:hypothetical protein Vadar_027763 [Vaccinium darrowii]